MPFSEMARSSRAVMPSLNAVVFMFSEGIRDSFHAFDNLWLSIWKKGNGNFKGGLKYPAIKFL